MEDEVIQTEPTPAQEEQFELTFKNGALINLKRLAGLYNISEENLGDVVNKGIRLLNLVKSVNTKQIVLETEDKRRYIIDADNI